MISGGIVLIDENDHPYIAAATQEVFNQFGWEFFDHPLYRPDLTPIDSNLFPKVKDFLCGERSGSDAELENTVTTWLNELPVDHNMEILKLVNTYSKCLNVGGDHLEKWRKLQVCSRIVFFFKYCVFHFTSPNGLYSLDGPRLFLRCILGASK